MSAGRPPRDLLVLTSLATLALLSDGAQAQSAGIADADGLDKVGFSYPWLSDGAARIQQRRTLCSPNS